MFESFKIKKLISQIIATSRDNNSGNIKALRLFGPDGLAALIEMYRKGKILAPDLGSYLNTFYEHHFLELYTELLGDPKEDVRKICKGIIEKRTGVSSIPSLIEVISDGNFLQKRAASDLIKKMGGPATVAKLTPLLESGGRDVKAAVIEIIGAIGGAKASAEIIKLLTSNDYWVRKKAVDSLCKLKDPSSVRPLMAQLEVERDPKIKSVIIATLGELGDPESARKLVRLISDDDIVVRQMVIEAVEKTADTSIVDDVIYLVKDSGDVNVRRAGVEILQNIKDPKATAVLIKGMRDSDWWVREISTDALTTMKSEDLTSKIQELFKSDDENVRRAAVEFFKRMPDESTFEPLLTLLKDDDWWVREKAVEALGELKDERAVDEIILLIDDPDVRWVVPKALANIGGLKSITFLTDFLQDPDRAVRLAALEGLGRIKDKNTLKTIKACVKDSDSDIRNKALEIIKEMTGRAVKASDIIAEQERQEWSGGSTVMSAYVPDKPQILVEAILVLDLCNSTEIGVNFGDDFALKITSRLVELTKPIATRHRVRFTKSTGDGYLMTFGELKGSLEFAKAISIAITQSNSKVPANEMIDIRIAINFGETRVDTKGDRLGTAVNKTFRVEGLKGEDIIEDEGGMTPDELPAVNRTLITEAVHEALDKCDGFLSKYVGLFDLKGISGRHRIYQMVSD